MKSKNKEIKRSVLEKKTRPSDKRGTTIFEDCLAKEGDDVSNFVNLDAFGLKVGFHPGRLESYKKEIEAMINELPEYWPFVNGFGTNFGWGLDRNPWIELYMLGIAIRKLPPQLVLTIGKGILP